MLNNNFDSYQYKFSDINLSDFKALLFTVILLLIMVNSTCHIIIELFLLISILQNLWEDCIC